MSSLQRTAIEFVVLLLLIGGGILYERHKGAQQCEQAQAVVVDEAKIHNAQGEAKQVQDDLQAKGKFDEAINQPIGAVPPLPASLSAPVCPSAVRQARGAAAPSAPAVTVRTEPPAAVVQPDWKTIERSDLQSARDADAEVTYWKGLLIAQYKLCGGK